MPARNPKAFISHSTKDREFVERFAADLRKNGGDAWYSGWEIKAGESIRARIDEGLVECDIFIIVLSKASIGRPWVQAELDAATVRKLDGKVQKIIPIKIDDCGELPPILASLLWEDFSTRSYDAVFKAVLNSIFSLETKPSLGAIPDLRAIVAFRTPRISTTAAIFWTAMAVAVVLVASKLTINLGIPLFVGQVLAGILLAGTVWLFFERVEAVLNEDTKLEIWVWLADRRPLSPTFQSWPDTFAKVFDRVFGINHFSFTCFWRCSMASLAATGGMWVITRFTAPRSPLGPQSWYAYLYNVTAIVVANTLPDYIAYLFTRVSLKAMIRYRKSPVSLLIVALDLGATLWLSSIAFTVAFFMFPHSWKTFLMEVFNEAIIHPLYPIETVWSYRNWTFIFPAFFTTIWLWLYVGAGFLLRAARRFDIGFQWFNRHADIEKKPLQSIGLVAGALVALIYWGAVIVRHIV